MNKNNCIDCGIEISQAGTRCKSCCRKGELNHFYGKHHTEATKQTLRENELGKVIPLEQVERMRSKLIGREITWGDKISKASKGKPKSADHIKNAVESRRKNWNYNFTEQHKNKIKESRKKYFDSLSKEEKLILNNKISKSLKGRHVSPETEFKKGIHSLENHPCWLGGISFEPYSPEFNKEFKNLVRLRDNFCCLNCGVSEQKHLIIIGKKLYIHHIDYNKKNTCLMNCCTLCNKCNIIANKNRNEWAIYYQEKLSKLYNYEYNKYFNVATKIEIKN